MTQATKRPLAPLVITVGASASGKTTFAQKITWDGIFSWIERDAINRMFIQSSEEYTPEIGKLAKQEQNNRWCKYALECVPVCISNTHLKESDLSEWLREAKAYDYELVIVLKSEPLDVLLLRNDLRNKNQQLPEDVIRAQLEQFEALLSSNLQPEITEAIEKGKLIANASNGSEVMRLLGYKSTWSKNMEN